MTQKEIAERLLWPIWRGIPDGYKSKYARNIWTQFESNLRSAAYTSSLSRFAEKIRLKLDIEVRKDDSALYTEALGAADERAVLKCIRDETTYLVLLVRVRNDERKAVAKEKFEETERLDRELKEKDENTLF